MNFTDSWFATKKPSFEYLIESIIHDEGFRGYLYRCTANKLTVGYGHNIEDLGITELEAKYILYYDIYTAYLIAKDTIPHWDELGDIRQAAFINMAFNLGIKIKQFKKMLKYLKRRDFNKAADEMLDSKWAVQVGNRASRLATEVRTGVMAS